MHYVILGSRRAGCSGLGLAHNSSSMFVRMLRVCMLPVICICVCVCICVCICLSYTYEMAHGAAPEGADPKVFLWLVRPEDGRGVVVEQA